MKKVDKKISALTEDFANELYYDRDAIMEHYSYDLGKRDNQIETARRLLKKNMSIEDILEITEFSKEELDNIISEEPLN